MKDGVLLMAAIDYLIKGIKCDAKECDYADMDVSFEDYEEYVNKPCPKCESNLLTKQDFDNVKGMVNMANMINSIYPEQPEEKEVVQMNVKMDGTGDIDLEIKEEKNDENK